MICLSRAGDTTTLGWQAGGGDGSSGLRFTTCDEAEQALAGGAQRKKAASQRVLVWSPELNLVRLGCVTLWARPYWLMLGMEPGSAEAA